MNIAVIADVLNGLQSNGVIKSSHKLDSRDFLQLARAAKGSVIRKLYYEEKQNDTVYQFVASNLKEDEYDVDTDGRGRITVCFDFEKNKIVKLPEGNGIIRITAIFDDGKIDYSNNFSKGIAGSEYLYCTKKFLEDTGEKIYMATADQVRLFTDTAPKKVEMLAVVDNDDTDIPEDVAWEIINSVLAVSLRVVGFPVDKTDDANPNVQQIKSKLSSPQTL